MNYDFLLPLQLQLVRSFRFGRLKGNQVRILNSPAAVSVP